MGRGGEEREVEERTVEGMRKGERRGEERSREGCRRRYLREVALEFGMFIMFSPRFDNSML